MTTTNQPSIACSRCGRLVVLGQDVKVHDAWCSDECLEADEVEHAIGRDPREPRVVIEDVLLVLDFGDVAQARTMLKRWLGQW